MGRNATESAASLLLAEYGSTAQMQRSRHTTHDAPPAKSGFPPYLPNQASGRGYPISPWRVWVASHAHAKPPPSRVAMSNLSGCVNLFGVLLQVWMCLLIVLFSALPFFECVRPGSNSGPLGGWTRDLPLT
jgi:hypothetical protein